MQSVGVHRFEVATMPHLNAVFQTALRLTESRAEAGEIVNEVYDCALKAFERGEEWSDPRVALFKILMQRVRGGYRSWPDVQQSEAVPELDRVSYSHEQVVCALRTIPKGLREIIVLIDGQEFSYNEAAEILDLSTEAVAARVAVARNRLRSALLPYPLLRGGVAAPYKQNVTLP